MPRYAYGPIDPETARMNLLAAQNVYDAALALSELTKARNRRVLGVQVGEHSAEYNLRTETDRAVAAVAQAMVESYFMPTFVDYWSLRAEWLKRLEYSIVGELDEAIQKFRGSYSLYYVIFELAMWGMDMKFSEVQTIRGALGMVGEDGEEEAPVGPSYLVADQARIEATRRGQYAARDRTGIGLEDERQVKEELPTFEEALEFARLAYESTRARTASKENRRAPRSKKARPKKNAKTAPIEAPAQPPKTEPEPEDEELEFFKASESNGDGNGKEKDEGEESGS